MAGSDKRLTVAQRKKIQVRYEKSGLKNKSDPALDILLAAASMVPVAGLAARGAAVGRTAATAAKASRAKKKYKKNEREAYYESQGDGPQPPTTRREWRQETRNAAKSRKTAEKTVKKADAARAKRQQKASSDSDDAFASIVAKVAAEGARQSGRKVPARGSAAEKKKLGQAAKRVKKDVKSIRASGSPAKDRKIVVKRRGR